VFVSTQDPLQLVVPVGQVLRHALFAHTAPPRHVLPHPPQFAASLAVSTQVDPQIVCPAGQAHVPLHTCPPVHALPQPPQLAGSAAVSTHVPPHSVCPACVHAHCPFTQALPPAQAWSQPPQ
jgi:hypothetical protein